jgi:hypothetical protein
MRRISAYSISIVFLLLTLYARAQDTVSFPLKIKIGADLVGPVSYFSDKNTMSLEGFLSIDIDTSKSYVLEAGYLNFKYEQYNYSYNSRGGFIKLGIDFNLLSPFVGQGKYYAGLGLRYGLGVFRAEVPGFEHENYWGTATGSIPASTHMAHFLEVSPGIRAELFRNLDIGWAVRLRLLVYSGTGKDVKAIYIPGFGNGSKSFSPGINYFLIWSIPYKYLEIK